MFPLMKMFDKHHIPYTYIHTGQHYGIIKENAKLFHVRQPDIYLSKKKKDLQNVWDLLRWAPEVLWNARKLPIKQVDYVLNHGDTESTLLTLLITKFFRANMIHIESGMRSGTYLEPFPEEIIRSLTDNLADVRFCPYPTDFKYLAGKKNTYVTNGNTGFDAVNVALHKKPSQKVTNLSKKKYVVFLVHRKETLFLQERTQVVLNILEMILKKGYTAVWPMHANTKYQLKKNGFWPQIQSLQQQYDLQLEVFFNYIDFIHLLKGSVFAASDGDGVQEESYYLNKPALILRKVTDSLPGIGENAYISYLQPKRATYFLNNFKKIKSKTKPVGSPSKVIFDYILTSLKSTEN